MEAGPWGEKRRTVQGQLRRREAERHGLGKWNGAENKGQRSKVEVGT